MVIFVSLILFHFTRIYKAKLASGAIFVTTKKKTTTKMTRFTVSGFVKWCQENFRTGPFAGKPYASATVLVKVALGLSPQCWKFIAAKFAESREVLVDH